MKSKMEILESLKDIGYAPGSSEIHLRGLIEVMIDIRDLINERFPETQVINTTEKPSNRAQIQLFTERDFPIEIMEDAGGSILWWDATATKWRPMSELTLRAEDENSTAPAALNITEESMGIFHPDFYV